MGFRFSKRIKIMPGVRLNISKSGVSTTLGGGGLSANIGKKSRVTAGIPGTGLSYSQRIGGGNSAPPGPHPGTPPQRQSSAGKIIAGVIGFIVVVWILL